VSFQKQVGGSVPAEITLYYSLKGKLLHNSVLGRDANRSAVIVISQPKAYCCGISLGMGKVGQKDQKEDLNEEKI